MMHRKHSRFNAKILSTVAIWLSATDLSTKLRYPHLSKGCYYHFVCLKIQIWFSYNSLREHYRILDSLFSNLLLKGSKYYANLYCRHTFGLKKGNQLLVSRRRPFGTPLPTRPCIFRASVTTSIESFDETIKYWISVNIHVLLKCDSTGKQSQKMSNDHKFLADAYGDED